MNIKANKEYAVNIYLPNKEKEMKKSIQQIEKQAFNLLVANAESANEARAKQIIDISNRYCDNIERFWRSVNYNFVKNLETSRSIYAGY